MCVDYGEQSIVEINSTNVTFYKQRDSYIFQLTKVQ